MDLNEKNLFKILDWQVVAFLGDNGDRDGMCMYG